METNENKLTTGKTSHKNLVLLVSQLYPRKGQPRHHFSAEKIQELAVSIKNFGLIQPIVVKPKNENDYWIVSGERRWRAASLIGLKEVPCIIADGEEKFINEIALIENIQRENLNPIEEALALKQLLEQSGSSLEKLSEKLGKKRSSISNSIRLLTLPTQVQEDLKIGLISTGHAKLMCGLDNPVEIERIRKQIVAKGVSVRQCELIIKKSKKQNDKSNDEDLISNGLRLLCDQLKGHLSTKVKISGTNQNGKIEVCYFSMEDLERITDLILGNIKPKRIIEEETSNVQGK